MGASWSGKAVKLARRTAFVIMIPENPIRIFLASLKLACNFLTLLISHLSGDEADGRVCPPFGQFLSHLSGDEPHSVSAG